MLKKKNFDWFPSGVNSKGNVTKTYNTKLNTAKIDAHSPNKEMQMQASGASMQEKINITY